MLLALVSWAQSVRRAVGREFHVSSAEVGVEVEFASGCVRRYTCADDRLSTWNHMSSGQPWAMRSSSLDRLVGWGG